MTELVVVVVVRSMPGLEETQYLVNECVKTKE